jgi:DNA-binding CsgD family transcriptional regulator
MLLSNELLSKSYFAEQESRNNMRGISYAPVNDHQALAKVKLTHTPAEHLVYLALLCEVTTACTRVCAFSARSLLHLTRLPNLSATRRALNGLLEKLSIEQYRVAGDPVKQRQTAVYFVFSPEEILARRASNSKNNSLTTNTAAVNQAVEQIADRYDLSRREAEVALCCAEGLTNTEIGARLHISEQTVKFHLRHIFVKYGVKRRTELISQLLSHRPVQK